MFKSKKGDIPITILVIGIIAICVMAIGSFAIFDSKTKSDLNSAGVVEKAAVNLDKILLYENLGFDQAEVETLLNVQTEPGTNRKYLEFEQSNIKVIYYLKG